MTDYSTTYDPDTDFDRWYTLATGRAIAEWVKPDDRVLEMGCATGLMTSVLATKDALIVGVDHSSAYIAKARERCPHCGFVCSDIASEGFYDDPNAWDHIVATNVIHELSDPGAFLRHCHTELRPDGLLHLASQNPHSIHRLVALEMGLINDLCEVSDRGQQWATLRLFTAVELEAMAVDAGFTLIEHQGIMLKPLPNDLMATLPDAVLEGFVRAARHFSRDCAVNYLTLRA